jgi:hypothetical protein
MSDLMLYLNKIIVSTADKRSRFLSFLPRAHVVGMNGWDDGDLNASMAALVVLHKCTGAWGAGQSQWSAGDIAATSSCISGQGQEIEQSWTVLTRAWAPWGLGAGAPVWPSTAGEARLAATGRSSRRSLISALGPGETKPTKMNTTTKTSEKHPSYTGCSSPALIGAHSASSLR